MTISESKLRNIIANELKAVLKEDLYKANPDATETLKVPDNYKLTLRQFLTFVANARNFDEYYKRCMSMTKQQKEAYINVLKDVKSCFDELDYLVKDAARRGAILATNGQQQSTVSEGLFTPLFPLVSKYNIHSSQIEDFFKRNYENFRRINFRVNSPTNPEISIQELKLLKTAASYLYSLYTGNLRLHIYEQAFNNFQYKPSSPEEFKTEIIKTIQKCKTYSEINKTLTWFAQTSKSAAAAENMTFY